MAVGVDVVEKNLEDLEKEITCAICQEHYTDPKTLPCLHCYCKQCILKLALRVGQGKPFPCPECRKDTVLPEGGVEELQSEFKLNRLKSMYLKHKKALSKQVTCEICNVKATAEAFCHQCDKFVCKNCIDMHSVMTALFEGHECVPIEQLQKFQSEQLLPKHPEPKKCSIHKKKLKIFCFDCNKLICRDCTVKDHRDHNIEFNNVAADDKKKQLLEMLKPLKEVKTSLSQSIKDVNKAESEIKTQQNEMTHKIETSFDDLCKILELRKQQLLGKVNRNTEDKIKNLNTQKEKLSIASAEVHSVIDYTEQSVKLCSDDEVMSMHRDIMSKIQTQITESNKQKTDTEISEKADLIVEVDCAEALQQFCEENTWVANNTIAEMLDITEVPKTMETGEELKFTIQNKSGKTSSAKNLKCQFQCIDTAEVYLAKTNAISANKYEITYTPPVCGRYNLTISAYDYPVPGSPFTIVAYLSPMELNCPTKVWNNVTSPFSIAINSHKEIFIAEYYKAIEVFNEEGHRIRFNNLKSLKINGLRRLAIDHEDNVYYIGESSNNIGKCDRYFNHIQVQEVKQLQESGHYDITVVGEEILVTEWNNKGQITVYDRDLNFVRRISTTSKTTLRHMCSDSHGNLHVSNDDCTIVVLDMKGNILSSFNRVQNEITSLKDPWMVHVFGHYVYVADWDLKKTVVFTNNGKYITTFGCYGPLHINNDGVVFGCDHVGHHVNIY